MDETQEMACALLPSQLDNKCKDILIFQEELCDAVVATVKAEAGVLDDSVQLCFASNAGCSTLQELHIAYQFESHYIAHDALDEVAEVDIAPEHGVKCVVLTAEQHFLAS